MPLGQQIETRLLQIDLIGIGVMIFGLTITAIYVGLHNWPTERTFIMGTMAFLFVANFGVQLTPCYNKPENHWFRVIFYCTILGICAGLALAGRFVYGTSYEIETYYG
jgi:predicted membrane channel-forming protein YqfA (hemolysin III family)